MELNSPQALLQALRESGLWTAEQVAAGEKAVAAVGANPAALADRLQQIGPLTPYQARKVKVNRIIDLLYDPFLILEKIGEGGMGKVYRAIQQRIGKQVALKVVRPHLMTNRVVLRRYKREAAAAAALKHPNIVSLFDAGESAERHFLAMEYVEGSDLARLLKLNGPLPYQEACEYIRQAALGLQHAHEQSLIHRDIKPSNLLVSGERALPGTDGKATVKILDMGLVRSLSETEEDMSRSELTRDGTVVGTPDYMSPEQAKNSSTVDARADVYSLGCTLFFLITGKPPFPEGSPIDKLLRHQLDPPPDLKKLRKDLPPGLIALINKTLKKKPEERFQTAGELARALAAYTPAADSDLLFAPAPPPTPTLPDSLASPEPAAAVTPSPGFRAVKAGEVGFPPPPLAPATPTPKPKQKRVLTPIGPAKPIPKPAAVVSGPDTDSLPGTDAHTVTPRVARRVPARKSAPSPHRNLYVIGGAVGGVLLLVGLVALAVSGGAGTKPTGTTGNPSPGPAHAGGGNPTAAVVSPAVLLPDGAVAALVAHPQPYWNRAAFDIKPASHASEVLRRLTNGLKLDPRQFDRVVIGWTGAPGDPFTVVGEGEFVTPSWVEGVKGVARSRDEASVAARSPFQFRSDGSPFLRREPWAAILGTEAYLVGTEVGPLTSITRRYSDRTPAKIDPALAAVLPSPDDPDPPLVTFVATGDWTPPHAARSLSADSVRLLVLTARLGEESIDVRLTLTGSNKAVLKDYASLFLCTTLPDKVPGLKPFAAGLAGEPEWDLADDRITMKLVGSWPLHDVAEWIDPLLAGGKE